MKDTASVRGRTNAEPDDIDAVPLGRFWARVSVVICGLLAVLSAIVAGIEVYCLASYLLNPWNPLRDEALWGMFMTFIYGGIFVGAPTWILSAPVLAPAWLTWCARTSVIFIAAPIVVAVAMLALGG